MERIRIATNYLEKNILHNKYFPKLLPLALFITSIGVLLAAVNTRNPYSAKFRTEMFFIVIFASTALIIFNYKVYRNVYIKQRITTSERDFKYSIPIISISSILLFLGIIIPIGNEIQFRSIRTYIENSSESDVEKFGKHIVLGYSDFDEIKKIVQNKGVSGIYITQRNIKGKSLDDLKNEIEELQKIQKDNNLPPLLIAADHEGGLVSRLHLSPHVEDQPEISNIIGDSETLSEKQIQEISDYAETQAKDLNEIGINLNFSPVVDLKFDGIDTSSSPSKISLRAMSKYPSVVSAAGITYAETLEDNQIISTLKHFPGLGRQISDTHTANSTSLTTPIKNLKEHDLIPFKEITSNTNSFIMLSHTKISDLDKQYPTSFSDIVVNQFIRSEWEYDGILITDDFSMDTVYMSPDGIEGASVKSINSGVDLILITYDTDLYYPVMKSLIEANADSQINIDMLDKSANRLNSYLELLK